MARPIADDEDAEDAPWLAEVEPERRTRTLVPRAGLLWGIGLALLLLAVIVGGVAYIASQDQASGSTPVVADPAQLPLIAAPPGPYKVRPTDDGGLTLEGADELIYEASEGGTPGGDIDVGALPETPLDRPGTEPPPIATDPTLPAAIPPARGPQDLLPPAAKPEAAPAPVALPKTLKPLPKPAATPPAITAEPLPKPVAGTAALQLGAFSSAAAADAAWQSFTKRYGYLAGLKKAVATTTRDGKTLYRLRAAGVADSATAADLCARLKVAGEECLVAQ